MNHRVLFLTAAIGLACALCATEEASGAVQATANLATEGETHIRNIRQLTSGGENAEAYWAFDGSRLIYQAKKPGAECDQIYIMDPATGDSHLVSTGEGRTTCSYFYPSGDHRGANRQSQQAGQVCRRLRSVRFGFHPSP